MGRLWLVILILAGASPCAGHELWLSPSSYRAGAGDTVSVSSLVGTGFGGAVVPFDERRVLRLEWRGSRVVDLRRGGVEGDAELARWVVLDGSGGMVVYESSFRAIELPAEEFERYLREEGLDGPLRLRAMADRAGDPGRERYARCAKAWVGGDSRRAAVERSSRGRATAERAAASAGVVAGLPLEIVPSGDPSVARESLEVRVLFRGAPLAGARVRAWRRPLARPWVPVAVASRDSVGPAGSARTDSAGRVMVPLDGSGEWLVNCVHMVPSSEPAEANWDSWWASLTFAR